MISWRIQDEHSVFRASVFPIVFRSSGTVYDSSKLFYLGTDPQSGAIICSVAWEGFAPTLSHVHSFGCRLAAKRNEKLAKEGKLKPKNRRVYCGSYGIRVAAVRSLIGMHGLPEVVSADVLHHVEDSEIAHANLTILLANNTEDIEGTKTAIVDRLLHASRGPLLHVCGCDADIDKHPSADLTPGIGGQCRYGISLLSTFRRLARYWCFLCLWRLGVLKIK
jgi:hypothetical protein